MTTSMPTPAPAAALRIPMRAWMVRFRGYEVEDAMLTSISWLIADGLPIAHVGTTGRPGAACRLSQLVHERTQNLDAIRSMLRRQRSPAVPSAGPHVTKIIALVCVRHQGGVHRLRSLPGVSWRWPGRHCSWCPRVREGVHRPAQAAAEGHGKIFDKAGTCHPLVGGPLRRRSSPSSAPSTPFQLLVCRKLHAVLRRHWWPCSVAVGRWASG
jgi:hypothetical protein